MIRDFTSLKLLVREVRMLLPEKWRPSFCYDLNQVNQPATFKHLGHSLNDFVINFGERKGSNALTKRAGLTLTTPDPVRYELTVNEGDELFRMTVTQRITEDKSAIWYEADITYLLGDSNVEKLWYEECLKHGWRTVTDPSLTCAKEEER